MLSFYTIRLKTKFYAERQEGKKKKEIEEKKDNNEEQTGKKTPVKIL
jgi:hypothetical protein